MCDSGDSMGELTQGEGVYTEQVTWRTVLNWLDFVFRLFSEIIGGAFSHYPLSLSFSSSSDHHHHSFHLVPVIEHQSQEQQQHHHHHHRQALPIVPVTDRNHRPLRKFTVVLDLDETLICAYEKANLPAALRAQAIKAGLNWFDLECVCSEDAEGKPKINHITVFERPGLKEFLRKLSEFADVVLFTAGLEGYASPLVDRIDSENRISQRFYRPSTVSTEYREHVKDLTCISNDLCHIVIVDNNPFSFLLQPDNGVPCITFSAEQPYDTELLDVILPILKNLSGQKDVRHVLNEKYNMPQWFKQQGIPASP